MKKKVIPLMIVLACFSLLVAQALAKGTRDAEGISGNVSPSVYLCEFPSEGAYEGSAVKVTISDTSPDDSTVTVNIIDSSAPWYSYYEDEISEGESTGWIYLGQQYTRFHVQIWYAGDTCSFSGTVQWVWP